MRQSDCLSLKIVQTYPADAVATQMIVQTKNYTVLALSDFLKVNGEIVMKSKSKIFDVKFDDRMMLMVENPNPKSVVLSQIPINMLT